MVDESDRFRKDLAGFEPSLQERLGLKLESHIYPVLRSRPHAGPNIRRLQGVHPPVWRYRVGDYRIFYMIDFSNRTVSMIGIENRRDAYR